MRNDACYLLDGYNLLFRHPAKRHQKLEQRRNNYLKLLSEGCDALKLNLIVVFDAATTQEAEQRGFLGRMQVVYTSPQQSADEWIINHLSLGLKNAVVVTNDRELANRSMMHRATSLPVDIFFAWIWKKIQKKPPPLLHQQHKENEEAICTFSKGENWERWKKTFEMRLKELERTPNKQLDFN